jgi:hypothetical protein
VLGGFLAELGRRVAVEVRNVLGRAGHWTRNMMEVKDVLEKVRITY